MNYETGIDIDELVEQMDFVQYIEDCTHEPLTLQQDGSYWCL